LTALESLAVPKVDFILAVLFTFEEQGRKEVSLPEFLECVARLEEELSLGYKFSEKFVYSASLLRDMEELSFSAYVRQIRYVYDSFLPKRYLTLSALGRGRARRIVDSMPERIRGSVVDAVRYAMKAQDQRWRLWARPMEPS